MQFRKSLRVSFRVPNLKPVIFASDFESPQRIIADLGKTLPPPRELTVGYGNI